MNNSQSDQLRQNKLFNAGLQSRQLLMAAYIKTHRSVSFQDLRQEYKVKPATIYKDVALLEHYKLITIVGTGYVTRYEA